MTDHFDRFVVQSAGCHVWVGGRDKDGYGIYRPLGSARKIRATRFAFKRAFGYLPVFVCHRCDNPPCVNPDHLFPGDAAVNVADMVAKGRRAPLRNGRKLSDEQARAIRARHGAESMPALALEFGVSTACIFLIVKGRTYRSAYAEVGS